MGDSLYGAMFSLYPDRVFVEGEKNEEYSFLGLYIALFCFKIKVMLKIVVICRYLNCKRVSLCVRVFHSQLFILVYRRSSIPRHLEMFLM